MKNYVPAHVPPPGEILKEELEARGWSQADLAEILGRPPRVVSEIISAKRAISPETAQGLGEAFGVNPQFWLNLESAYQLYRTPSSGSGVAWRAKLFQKAPIKELVRRHWIEAATDPEVLQANLLAFYGVNSLEEEPEIWQHAARKSSSYDEELTPSQLAWLCRARRLAQHTEAAPYDESRLDDLITLLRSLLLNPEDVRKVPRILSEYGIRLVIVEPLTGSHIDGACFWLAGRFPVIALSVRYDRIDAFWFTLLHEMGHIKAKDGLKNGARPLDTDLVGQGAVKSELKPREEQAADRFATEALISTAKLNSFITRI